MMVSLCMRNLNRGAALFRAFVHVGSTREQVRDNFLVSILAGHEQRARAVTSRHVYIPTVLRKILGDINLTHLAGPIQGVRPEHVLLQYVCTFSAKVSHGLEVTGRRCGH
jgi:hypothetical protein